MIAIATVCNERGFIMEQQVFDKATVEVMNGLGKCDIPRIIIKKRINDLDIKNKDDFKKFLKKLPIKKDYLMFAHDKNPSTGLAFMYLSKICALKGLDPYFASVQDICAEHESNPDLFNEISEKGSLLISDIHLLSDLSKHHHKSCLALSRLIMKFIKSETPVFLSSEYHSIPEMLKELYMFDSFVVTLVEGVFNESRD